MIVSFYNYFSLKYDRYEYRINVSLILDRRDNCGSEIIWFFFHVYQKCLYTRQRFKIKNFKNFKIHSFNCRGF